MIKRRFRAAVSSLSGVPIVNLSIAFEASSFAGDGRSGAAAEIVTQRLIDAGFEIAAHKRAQS